MIGLGAHVRIGISLLTAALSVSALAFSAAAQQPPARQEPAKPAPPIPVPAPVLVKPPQPPAAVAKPAQLPAVAAPAPAVPAQAPQNAPQNAAGIGTPWKAEVKDTANQSGMTLEPAQIDAIKKVDGYFNELVTMQGRFMQTTSADKKQTRGRFYVKKPGLFRFDYAPPSKLVILSDGANLAIEDHDLKQVNSYPIDSTPFRLLLRKDVNLLRDARIMDLQAADDIVILTIIDKAGDSTGAIKLIFVQKPAFELQEWVITDALGVETRIEVSELEKAKPIDSKKFVSTSFGVQPTTGQ
jgi:outer membrane lipoprotein-sorting protein